MKALSFAVALAVSSTMSAMAQDTPPSAAAPIDADRLTAAQLTAGKLFPDGTYARMMSSMDGLMDSMMGQIMQMPLADLARMGGVPERDIRNLSKASMKEMMSILDPAFEKRMGIVMKVTMGEMGRIMGPLEPGMRDGLAQAYAKRFTTAELADLNRFFATPTGSAFASDYMMLMMDPAVMNKMMEFVPTLTKEMPAMVQKIAVATADLPKPRTYKDLSGAERKRLADLLGVPESRLNNSGRK